MRAAANDPGGDTTRETLLAELPQHPCQGLLVVGVDDVGRGERRIGVHPHVQRGVGGVGEAARGAVQLHRRHAEVEQDAMHLACPVTGFGEHALDPVVAGAHQHDPVTELRQPLACDPQGVGVAVEPDQPKARQLGEEALGVPTGPQCGVDEDGAIAVGVLSGERGSQQLDTAVQQDREVSVILGHRSASDEGPCTEVPVRERGPGVGEVRQGRFGQRPRCTGNVSVSRRVK